MQMAYEVDDIAHAAHGGVISHRTQQGRKLLFETPLAQGIRYIGDIAHKLAHEQPVTDEELAILVQAARGVVPIMDKSPPPPPMQDCHAI